MQLQVDLIQNVVLLIDRDYQVRDAFMVKGVTDHATPYPVHFYTYRSLLTQAGECVLCGRTTDAYLEPCVSSGGYHAFAGAEDDPNLPLGHHASQRSVALHALHYDDMTFYVEADNLFPIDQIVVPMSV